LAIDMRSQNTKVERFATRAYGVVTREEMLAVGLTNGWIGRRIRDGTLLRDPSFMLAELRQLLT
jgi:hypothetical protein